MLKIKTCAELALNVNLGGMFCADKRVVGFYLLRKGIKIPLATFDSEALDDLIKERNLIGMISYFNVDNNDQEADYATSVDKQRFKTIEGVKGFTFTIAKGSCFQNEISKLDNTDAYQFIIAFEDGSLGMATDGKGNGFGFDARIFLGIKQVQTTADVAGTVLNIDILPSGMRYWQSQSITVASDEVDFTQVQPIEGVTMLNGAMVTAGTSLKVTVTGACSGAPITGLSTAANWRVYKGSAELTPSAVTANGNVYTLTITAVATGDKITSGFVDSVYALDNAYYGVSNQNTVTVTAS